MRDKLNKSKPQHTREIKREREIAYIRTKLKLQIRVTSGESASFGKME